MQGVDTARRVPLESAEGMALWRRMDDREDGIKTGDVAAALWWTHPHYYVGPVQVGPDGVSLGLRISRQAFGYLGDAHHVVRIAESRLDRGDIREHVPSRTDGLDALLAIWIAESWLEALIRNEKAG